MTRRQLDKYLDAARRRLHNDRAERWGHLRLTVAAMSGAELEAYPDYAESEEDYNEDWESALSANPLVVHVAQQPMTQQQE